MIGLLRERHPDAVVSTPGHRGDEVAVVRRERLVEVCRSLKEDPRADLKLLAQIAAVQTPEDVQQIIHRLHELLVPAPGPHSGGTYVRHTPRRELDIAVVGVAGCRCAATAGTPSWSATVSPKGASVA